VIVVVIDLEEIQMYNVQSDNATGEVLVSD